MPKSIVNERFAHAWNIRSDKAMAIHKELQSHVVVENKSGTANTSQA